MFRKHGISCRFVILVILLTCFCATPGLAEILDDFEDGVIDSDIWAIGQGNYDGGSGWGEVSEHSGALVLDCFDGTTKGAGVSCAVLKQAYVGIPISFSFSATISDTDFDDSSYIPRFAFQITGSNSTEYITGVSPPKETVYTLVHDQQQATNEYSGSYYFLIDSGTSEAQLYNNDDNSLLGSVNYSHFGTNPYIAFNAYTDVYLGSATVSFNLNDVSTDTPADCLPGTIQYIGADALHGQGITGSGVKIGMVESGGVPWSAHPAVNGKITGGDSDKASASEHATEVAGITVGSDTGADVEGTGKGYRGVAPGATVNAAHAVNAPDIDNRVADLGNAGCDVVNISCRTSPDNLFADEINRTIDDIVDSDKITIVATAGNAFDDSHIVTPGNAYNVITVGSLEGTFSGTEWEGPWNTTGIENIDGPTTKDYQGTARSKPDIVAPGACEVADLSTAGYHASDRAYSSYSTPHVTGAVALMIQAVRDENAYFLDGDVVDPRVIKSALLTSADKSVTTSSGRSWSTIGAEPLDRELGAGGLDAEESVLVMLGVDDESVTRHMAFDFIKWEEGQDAEMSLSLGHLDPGTELEATLVWNAHVDILSMTLNDLDLRLFRDGTQLCASSLSDVDNVEHIYAPSLSEAGDYSLVVTFDQKKWSGADSEWFALSYRAEVPEPATLGLLAFGGLSILKRRSRKRLGFGK